MKTLMNLARDFHLAFALINSRLSQQDRLLSMASRSSGRLVEKL